MSVVTEHRPANAGATTKRRTARANWRGHFPRGTATLRGRKKKGKDDLSTWLHDALAAHLRFCRDKKGLSEGSIQWQARCIRRFLHFFARRGGRAWSDLSGRVISQFLHTLAPMKCATRKGYMGALRSFFRTMLCMGILDKDWTDRIPAVAPAFDAAEPYPWPPEDIRRLMDAIDRSTATGKRNYALFLLVARLGMRTGDAAALRLEDFDWDKNAIRFVQQKTGRAHTLPLLSDVGLAVIDYLRHGRPVSPLREAFLRHGRPYDKPLGRCILSVALQHARKRAGISIPRGFLAGPHSLRHALATRLLEKGAAWPTISGVLGHVCPDSTQIYAKSSTLLLRKVALDPEEVCHG